MHFVKKSETVRVPWDDSDRSPCSFSPRRCRLPRAAALVGRGRVRLSLRRRAGRVGARRTARTTRRRRRVLGLRVVIDAAGLRCQGRSAVARHRVTWGGVRAAAPTAATTGSTSRGQCRDGHGASQNRECTSHLADSLHRNSEMGWGNSRRRRFRRPFPPNERVETLGRSPARSFGCDSRRRRRTV